MRKMFLILMLLGIFLWSSINIQAQIHEYSIEVQRMQLEVEMLRLEQQELTNQVKNFINKWNVAVMEATSYSPDDKNGLNCDGNPHITSTGTRPGPGTIATNPSVIPYSSRLWVQGYGWGTAEDTGT